ncbi:alpha/beta hydrolase [Alkalihalobacillus sp. LMS6]|uniref:alpha/beta family hydrolase n=1 Tax=Bacillaceae TaxID=186817 RepID=UPI000C071E23|nr:MULTISPECIES: alpha/beta family hydrolase [Bacillaceae]UTR06935.1 alpha/beta hydrolase [Alkalihalobacillus sp. LMS6]
MKKWMKRILLLLSSIILLLIIAFFTWTQFTYDRTDIQGIQLSEPLPIEDDWIVYTAEDAEVGIVLYPGAKVEPDAYAYAAQELSKQGITVAVPSVTLNLSILDRSKANEIIDQDPDLDWYIGGHSMGGAAAAMYADEHLDEISGLILLGAYAASNDDLYQSSLPVLSLFGSEDGLSTPEKIEDTRENLPPTTDYIEIEGGNHAYFGVYGEQSGDGDADITVVEQQEMLIEEVVSWIDNHL